jgi:hypothetical protein
MRQRCSTAKIKFCGLLSLLSISGIAVPVSARASATVLLEQPYGKLDLVNPGGHSALYLDRVCAQTPVKLRPCGPGELGVVLSRYDGIDGRDWVAMPLLAYLYAVESADEIPASMDRGGEERLRDQYRRRHLEDLVPDAEDGSAPRGNWYQLLGASYDRTIYGFRVPTSAEQDAMLIAEMNDQRNVQRYNGVYRNCADFTRQIVNRFYPHSVRRNWIADVGITSPKSVARGLTRYVGKHPEVELDVFAIPQVKGSLPRSHPNTGVTEGVLKRYSLPLVVISPELEGAALVAYVVHGRFSVPKETAALDFGVLEKVLEISMPFPLQLPALPAPRALDIRAASGPVNGPAELPVALTK